MDSNLSSCDYRALAEFRHLIRKFLQFSETAAHAARLEPQQHQLLLGVRVLEPPPGPTIAALADFLLIRHHSAVGLVDRLEGRGLVRRSRLPPDRREVRVSLSPAGEATLEDLSVQHRDELRVAGPALVEALARVLRDPTAVPEARQ